MTNAIDVFEGTPVWFKLTVDTPCRISLGFDTCEGAPGIDSALEIFRADPDCGGLTLVAQEDNACPNGDDALIEFDAFIPGETVYYIVVTGTLTGSGTFSVQGNVLASGCGDPHFNRWTIPQRDTFHGECDLVLMHQDEINGKALDVHTRTTIRDSLYSYIEAVAMQYGDDKIEFQHDAVYLNGAKVEDDSEFTVGDIEINMIDTKKRKFNVKVDGKKIVVVYSTKRFMGVEMMGSSLFDGSTGILGDRETGDMVARDGHIMEKFEDFAFEWQVSPSDPKIFMDAREPQLPYERCRMPSFSAESRRRKLRGQDRKLYEEAVDACSKNHIADNVQSCVDDVMFTGELELAFD